MRKSATSGVGLEVMALALVLTIGIVLLNASAFAASKSADKAAPLEDQVAALQQRIAELEKQLAQSQPPVPAMPRFGSSFSYDWDPLREMEQMRRQINRMFQDSAGRSGQPGWFGSQVFELSTDMQETPTEYVYTIDVPGMEKDEIKVEVKDQTLYISGERKQDSGQNSGRVSRRERMFGSFSRVISLPPDARADQVKADYNKGVLTVKIPKKEGAAKGGFQIPVL